MTNCFRHLPSKFRYSLTGYVSLLALLVAQPAPAQTPSTMKEVVEVRVTNVEFVATDSKGKPVTGLTRDDFELFENGKPQPISNFFEAAGATQSTERKTAGPRRLVFFFDDSSLAMNNRKPILPAAKKLLTETMTPEDQVMIATFSRTTSIRLPWSNDINAANAVIDKLQSDAAGGRARQAERSRIERQVRDVLEENEYAPQGGQQQATGDGDSENPPPPSSPSGPRSRARAPLDFTMLLSSARAYATGVQQDFNRAAIALQELFATLAAVDGRKIVIIASESLPTRPGSEIFTYLEQIRASIISGDGPRELRQSAIATNVSAEAGAFNTNEVIVALSRLANAAGITVYALDPDTGGRSDSGNVERMDMQAMEAGVQGGIAEVDGLQVLAEATGGVAWISAKPAVALERLRTDIENYYSIGYQATTSGEAERKIDIRSKRDGVRIRAKKNIVFRSAESEMPDRVVSNLDTAQSNDLGISLQIAGEVVTEGKTRRVPVRVMIPARNLTLSQGADALTGGFSVYVCTAGGKGGPSGVQRQTHDIKWPPTVIDQLKDRDMVYALEVVLEEGRSQISVGVLDRNSQAMGFAKIGI